MRWWEAQYEQSTVKVSHAAGTEPMSPIPPIPPMWIRVEDLDSLEERMAAKAAPEQRRRA
jgi:hypothetical protein